MFLTDVVSGVCLPHQCFLETIRASFDKSEYKTEPSLHNWRRCIESVNYSLSPPVVTLRVHVKGYHYVDDFMPYSGLNMSPVTRNSIMSSIY